ncbi:transposase [uncultured Clostridium sp.]|uniref:transposase n=1 Tax=uncultured Clostridium sp. TaxID=59620 RepID=UPI00342C812C
MIISSFHLLTLLSRKRSHSVYNINYNIIFCPKYRHNIFKYELEYEISKMFKSIAFNYGFEVLEQEIVLARYSKLFLN